MSDRPQRRTGPAQPAARARPRLRSQLLFFLGIMVLAAGAFYTALVVTTQIDHIFFPGNEIRIGGTFGSLPGIDKGVASSDLVGRRINVLVMGLDKRPYEGPGTGRTDTMFVVTIDPATKTARGLGLPRDLYVDIASASGNSTYKERINTAYVTGEFREPGSGAHLARETVENLLGITIDHHVIIDFDGFKEIIDLLGGIDLDVPEPIYDPTYSETELLGDFYPCVFDVGVQHLNGSDALCYARTRYGSNDLDRIQRQQRVIFAMIDKATQLKILADPDNITSLFKQYRDTVDTDISDFQMAGYARLAQQVGGENLAFLSLGAATVPYTTPEGAEVLIPSPEGVEQLVTALLSDQRLLAEAAVVEIQNGTTTEGQATRVAEFLSTMGIPEASLLPANAADTGRVRTEIIDFAGKPYTAQRIAGWLGISADRVRQSSAADFSLRINQADIVVILGTDAQVQPSTLALPGD